MTFVRGPKQASFRDDKPAKLRFFVGYVDEFPHGDGSDRVKAPRLLSTEFCFLNPALPCRPVV